MLKQCQRINISSFQNPYTECPDYAVVPIPIDSDSLPNPKPNPDVLCRRCDLKLTADGVGVLLECNYCLDVPSPLRVAVGSIKKINVFSHSF